MSGLGPVCRTRVLGCFSSSFPPKEQLLRPLPVQLRHGRGPQRRLRALRPRLCLCPRRKPYHGQ